MWKVLQVSTLSCNDYYINLCPITENSYELFLRIGIWTLPSTIYYHQHLCTDSVLFGTLVFVSVCKQPRSRDSSVGIVTDYGLDDRGSIHSRDRRFFFLVSASRPALGSTQPPVQWVPESLSPGGEARPGRDADHSPPSGAEVTYE
jgi:hypothetical protein